MNREKFPKSQNPSLQFSSTAACLLDKDLRSEKIRQHAAELARRSVALRFSKS